MDPATAIGTAAAVVQFVKFSLLTLKTCREIRDDAKSATYRNNELEEATSSAIQFQKDFKSTPASATARRITGIAQACAKDAEDLVKLLKYVRDAEGKAKGKQASTAKLLFRTMKEKKHIEKLENQVKDRERRLNEVLVQSMHTNVDAIRNQLDQLDVSLRTNVAEIIKATSNLQIQLHDSIDGARSDIKAEIGSLDRRAEARRSEKQRSDLHQRFLDSLSFPDMHQRQDSIKHPASGTLDWLYNMQPNAVAQPWADFGKWLREDNSVYWISGKAASGKSTLMAHIVDDQRTYDSLRKWSQEIELCVLSFYFWRPGSELQKSNVGLLRSLLHQICVLCPTVIDDLQRKNSILVSKRTWTEKSLTRAVQMALSTVKTTKFCLFIDGLDEYEGDYDDLLNLVFQLQRLDYVKCCVSSRPETNLRSRLKACHQLRLEDWNRSDITTFVTEKLSTVELPLSTSYLLEIHERSTLIHELVHRANGVFLWAALVVRSLIKGIRSGDDLETLYLRIQQTPKELDDLFQRMVGQVDEVHKESLAFYVQAMKAMEHAFPQNRSICVFTAARLDGCITSYKAFADACMQTINQILDQSAGLLEVRRETGGLPSISKDDWHNAPVRFYSPALVHGFSGDPRRWRAPKSEKYPEVLDYEAFVVEWVHRTAFDFVFPPDGGPSLLASSHPVDDERILRRLCRGILNFFSIAPSILENSVWGENRLYSTTDLRLRLINIFCPRTCQDERREKVIYELIDQITPVVTHMDPDEFRGNSWESVFDAAKVDCTGEMIMLNMNATANRWNRVVHILNEAIARNPAEVTLFAYLAWMVDYHTTDFTDHHLKIRVVRAFLSAVYEEFSRSELEHGARLRITRRAFTDNIRFADDNRATPYGLGAPACFSVSCIPVRYQSRDRKVYDEPGIYALISRALWNWLHELHHWEEKCNFYLKLSTDEPWYGPYDEAMSAYSASISHDLESMLKASSVTVELPRKETMLQRRRLILQASIDLWLIIVNKDWESGDSLAAPESAGTLCLVCYPHGAGHGVSIAGEDLIHFDLRRSTVRTLLEHLRFQPNPEFEWWSGAHPGIYQVAGTPDELCKLQMMVLDDVWANEPGLNATDQLFVRACVRTDLLDWFIELDTVSEESDVNEISESSIMDEKCEREWRGP